MKATIIILCLLGLTTTWNAAAKGITNQQRLEIDNFQSVAYEKHLWYVFTFRNPHKLYKDL